MAAATYRQTQVRLPCDRVWTGEGPKRPAPDTHSKVGLAAMSTFDVACGCGTVHTVTIEPVVMVVGYTGRSW